MAGTTPRRCKTCAGTGQQVRHERRDGVSLQQITTCPDCGGRGNFIDSPCPECGGSGQTRRDEVLTVRIPIGADQGMALRIPGRGLPAEKPGLPPGDLFVIVRHRRGYAVRTPGSPISIGRRRSTSQTPSSRNDRCADARWALPRSRPAGTQSDALLRLRGKGLPRFGDGVRGDLYVRVRVQVPEHLTSAQRRLYEQLRTLQREGGRK